MRMRRAFTIPVLLLGAASLLGAFAYFLSLWIGAGVGGEAGKASAFDAALAKAAVLQEQRRFGEAETHVRLAIDLATTRDERVSAGHQMGSLLLEDWRNGGAVHLESASSYLEAAYAAASDPARRMIIGMELLDALQGMEDKDRYAACLDEMLATADTPEESVALWRRRLDFLMESGDGWQEMDAALQTARALPLDPEVRKRAFDDIQLRCDEKVLTDGRWFDAYATARQPDDPEECRRQLLAGVEDRLGNLLEDGDAVQRADAYLRLAGVLVAMGRFDEGYDSLLGFAELKPRDHLPESLALLCRIAKVRNEVGTAGPLAEALLKSADFNTLGQEQIKKTVDCIESLKRYDDALVVLEGRLGRLERSAADEAAELLARAVVIEERAGNRAGALDCMERLGQSRDEGLLGQALAGLLEIGLGQSDYTSCENWIQRFLPQLQPGSESHDNALFVLYECKYWLDRPVAEQLVVGAAAIQANPDDARAATVELRMARSIEDARLYDLAVSYYNRIGLLNFFQSDLLSDTAVQNVGEQAVLGKARCLKKLGVWVAADRLYRDLCRRTQSPLVKSAAVVGWAELALRDGQGREAERRYDMAHVQMLSEADQARYMLGRMQLDGHGQAFDSSMTEAKLEKLDELPAGERRSATISFFNQTFDSLHGSGDERAMLRVVDLACQSDCVEWLPIESYVLRLYGDKVTLKQIGDLVTGLQKLNEVADTSMGDLTQVAERLQKLDGLVRQQ